MDRRQDVDALDEARLARPPRRVGARRRIEHDQRHADDLVVEELLLAQPAVAHELAVVGREDDQRVAHPPGGFQRSDEAADVMVELRDEAHVRGPHVARHLLAREAHALVVHPVRAHDRMLVLRAVLRPAHDRSRVGAAIERVPRSRRDVRPVRLDVRKMQHPRRVALRRRSTRARGRSGTRSRNPPRARGTAGARCASASRRRRCRRRPSRSRNRSTDRRSRSRARADSRRSLIPDRAADDRRSGRSTRSRLRA